MATTDFFASWAAAADALPLAVTGNKAALAEALAKLKAHFPATDIAEIVPEGRTVPIEEIRALRAVVSQRAWSGKRLIIISQAEKLSVAAAQALLKILEEPALTSRFVLTTSWYRRLLPTIRSRCIRVRLADQAAPKDGAQPSPLPAGLAGLPPSRISRLAAYAGDTPLSAETLEQVAAALEEGLRQQGPTPALKTAYTRLRDYHRITAEPGSNYKLARDVLLASLPLGM